LLIRESAIKEVPLLGSTCWEASQLDLKSKAEALHNTFSNRISKASKKIQHEFTFNNIVAMFISLECFIHTRLKKSKNLDFFFLLVNPLFLLYCYTMLKRNVGHGIDGVPIENVTIPSISSLAECLRNGTYRPLPIKRVFIPKGNGPKLRPLGIASTRDKIVQKAILVLIEPVFDPDFVTESYGYRKGRSCHTALERIYYH
jgi:hypothetical protein